MRHVRTRARTRHISASDQSVCPGPVKAWQRVVCLSFRPKFFNINIFIYDSILFILLLLSAWVVVLSVSTSDQGVCVCACAVL